MLRVKLPSAGSSVWRSTGLSLTIQTSAAAPPDCMAIAATSAPEPMRAKPPGMICQPFAVRAAKTRSDIGRGTSLPSTQAGVVDSVTTSWPTSFGPSELNQSVIESLAAARNDEPSTDSPLSSKKGARE
jgi:hypothetical protein